MKKMLAMFLLFFLMFAIFCDAAKATSLVPGTPTLDPSANYTPQANDHRETSSTTSMCQSFITSKSVIANYLDVSVAGTSTSGVLASILIDNNNSPFGLGSLKHFNAPATFQQGNTTMTRFTTSSVTEVTPGQRYWLCLTSPVGNVVWWYSDNAAVCGPCQAGLYPNGNIWYNNGIIYEQDFGFKIYTSNMEEPTPDPTPDTTPDPTPDNTPTPTPSVTPTSTTTAIGNATPAASTPLPEGVTAGSGAAPAAPTASIKAPTEAVVIDVPADQGGALKLDWKASTTTDITGYKIFRSIEEKKSFAEVAKTTDKAILTYTDNTAAIGQKYYYLVRAYKDSAESASSNTVNGTSIDNLAPAAPKEFVYTKQALDFALAWDKNSEPDLAGYSLLISDVDGKVAKIIEIAKDLNTYELIVGDNQELEVGVAYQFALVAKDTNNNLSEKVTATEKTVKEVAAVADSGTKKNNNSLIWYVSGVLVLVLGGGGLYWFKYRKKKS